MITTTIISSPLEQFNILSLCDFSLVDISHFEIFYAKFLVFIWYIFCYFPISVYETTCDFLINSFPLPWSAIQAISFAYILIFDILLIFMQNLASSLAQVFSFFGLTSTTNPVLEIYTSALSFFWSRLHNNLDLLYSTDHLFFLTIFGLGTAAPGAGDHMFETINFSLIGGNVTDFWFSVANLHFLVSEVLFSITTWIYENTINLFLSICTKEMLFLIFSLNTSTIWLLLGFIFITFLFTSVTTSINLLSKNSWQSILETLYGVILGVVSENSGPKGIKHFPLIFTTFMLILVCNLLGMIPYSFTVTSHLIVTFSTALAIFIGINIIGILQNGKHFLSLFFPPGAPLGLAPLLVLIEIVSYVFRVLSLSIRLFANLMSGHTLLKILSSFAWAAVSFAGIFIIPIVVIFLITGLELAIACLQAYIFSVLLCIYINDAFNLH